MTDTTVVILGGGVGGLVAADALRRQLPQSHRIVLVEKNADHAFAPSFLWVMTGDRKPAQITRKVRRLVPAGVEVVQAQALGIDAAARRVETSAGPLAYDFLIVALGAELAPEIFPGLGEGGHTFYTLDGAARLRSALQDFSGGRLALVVAGLPYKCPAAPYEGAMLLADFFRQRGVAGRVELHLFTPEAQPMPVAGPELGQAVRSMVEARGITFHPLHRLAAVDAHARELRFEGQEAFRYDLLIAVPPHRGPGLLREAGLANEAGWAPANPATLSTRFENVYAIGDAAAVPLPGRWKLDVPLLLPKAGVFAHAQALVVARRIAGQITGAKAEDKFCGDGYCMLEAGESVSGFAFGNFFAEPSPEVTLRKIGKTWHWGKVLLEKWWLAPPGAKRWSLQLALRMGSKALGIPAAL
ncbi:MAG: NAD(P)/FAD-dependent oxidoreductase [Acidobacteria bacterium]|nr:NAD(P)/FAD-dependent oxidoreductase [Acidobacteriota bacterium]